MKSADLLELAESAAAWIGKKAPGLGAEVYLSRTRDRGIDIKEGRPETTQESSEEGMGLRLFDGERMAFAFAGGLGREGLPELFDRAFCQLPHLPRDRHRVLPEPQAPAPESGEALAPTLADPSLFTTPLREFLPELYELSARTLRADKRISKVLQAGYGENLTEAAVASTAGVRTSERGTSCSAGIHVLGGDGAEVQVGSAARSARFGRDLDLDRLVEEAVFRTVSLLGSRKPPSKRRAVLFDPWVAGELLDLLAGPMSAEAVQRNRSLLRGKMGRRVASPLVTCVDDPLRPGGIASGRFDDEGTPTRRKRMVERGVLREYFHDSYTARADGLPSNGCAGRPGFRGLPAATASNFYLEPGGKSRDQLIADTADGVLVLELMGMHTADPISGEMSVGVSGVEVLGGELGRGIRGAMLSCDLLGLFEAVDAVADDLTFYGSLAAPTFRAADLTVA